MRSENPFRPDQDHRWLRNLMELSILFVIAVMMLRGFLMEGYLISTGSMAPGLLGMHKRIECPSCHYSFAFGVTFDDSVDTAVEESDLADRYAMCPNCGQAHINVGGTPVNHGDQLLVHKGVFDFRSPRRWEDVVFRNPARPGEAYVKRLVGLPGETLQIIDGDLFIGGAVARKDFETQKEMRIEVFDLAHRVSSDEWEMPWRVTGNWRLADGLLTCSANASDGETPAVDSDENVLSDNPDHLQWLKFQNWRWTGGNHVCEVPLLGDGVESDWQKCLEEMKERPLSWMTRLEFDRDRMVLRLRGVMPLQMQRDLLAWADSDAFRQAVYRLGALSHLGPVTDHYGYNSLVSSPEYPVRDLMLDATLTWTSSPDIVAVRIPIGSDIFQLELNWLTGTAELQTEGTQAPLRQGTWKVPSHVASNGAAPPSLRLEVSNFDRRVVVAVDDTLLFEPLDLQFTDADAQSLQRGDGSPAFTTGDDEAAHTAEIVTQQNRLALGVSGGTVRVQQLKLYRDVHYTLGRRKNGIDAPFLVPKNAYFVLGDNSPVSSDSRSWPDPCVPRKLLIGKPFVVHLPSKPGKVTIGGYELPIRIPDFGRIRYIH